MKQKRLPTFADWAMHYSHDLHHSRNAEGLKAAIENAIELCAASVKAGERHEAPHA